MSGTRRPAHEIKYSASYKGFTIDYTYGAQMVPYEEADCVRLVHEAIDAGLFDATTTGHNFKKIRMYAGVHPFTVSSITGLMVGQAAHMICQCYTGGAGQYRVQLWVLPAGEDYAKPTTKLDLTTPLDFSKK